jgi:hypothetical protein
LSDFLIEPRFNIAWDFVGDGKTVLRMGGNIYRDRINSYVQQLENYPPVKSITYIFGMLFEDIEAYRRIVVDEDITNPTTYELMLGVDRELLTDLYFSANFIYRKYEDQIFTRYINLVDRQTGMRDDPTKGYQTLYSNFGKCDYKGLQLVLAKRWSHGFQFMISYSYQVSEGNSQLWTDFSQHQHVLGPRSGLMKGDPQFADLKGKTAFDKPYDFKVFGSFVLPFDFVLAGVFNYTAGTPYTSYNRRTYEFVSEYQALRSEPLMNIDMRLEKDFKIKGTVMKFMFEVFNLTNKENVREPVADVSSSSFGEPYRIGQPRRIQLGFRFQF